MDWNLFWNNKKWKLLKFYIPDNDGLLGFTFINFENSSLNYMYSINFLIKKIMTSKLL
jgi:hypothetical protein